MQDVGKDLEKRSSLAKAWSSTSSACSCRRRRLSWLEGGRFTQCSSGLGIEKQFGRNMEIDVDSCGGEEGSADSKAEYSRLRNEPRERKRFCRGLKLDAPY